MLNRIPRSELFIALSVNTVFSFLGRSELSPTGRVAIHPYVNFLEFFKNFKGDFTSDREKNTENLHTFPFSIGLQRGIAHNGKRVGTIHVSVPSLMLHVHGILSP